MLGAISLDLFAVLLGGATALLPIFADEIFHTGPGGLGLLRAAPAIGALAITVVLTHLAAHATSRRHHVRRGACFGLATIVFALSKSFMLSMAALAVAGRGGHGERGDPHDADPARNAGRDARSRQRGEFAVRPAPRISSAISAPA